MRFVLASQSPARLNVLRTAGIEPVVHVSGVDEDAVAAALPDPKPAEVVVALAAAKAEAVLPTVAAELDEAVVVGCDSMLLMDTPDGPQIVGKPASTEIARQRWRLMAGRSGELLTGHAVVRLSGGQAVARAQETMSTTVRWSAPSEAELEAYLASGEPLHVAGGFTLDGLGGWFVEGIDGDHGSVIGISLPLTRRLLAAVGVSVVDLWAK
ncbi:Maf-like protein [Crossiella sp. SN42]|uniref:Maf family protein n=1 Tax=Crossiella sp. SN42 TaxID=2944808 RepID=UPI00207C4334|nr:Maf family nucleotide pyrophosphatase [Crossiella sp. SN42]MCO1581085.1 Maf-like protein [Crossiella sp. SN42]